MRRVLMICYSWPPRGGVGAVRALKLAKYTGLFGWEPVVLTPDESAPGAPYREEDSGLGNVIVRRTGYADVLKKFKRPVGHAAPRKEAPRLNQHPHGGLKHLIREMASIPDENSGWYRYAVDEGLKAIDEEKIDLVFSTSPPETSHMIAAELKARRGIPWVADMRDMWSLYHHVSRPLLKRVIINFIERSTLKKADKVTTVSKEWADMITRRNGLAPGSVIVIPNGFDEEDYGGPIESSRHDKFNLVYTGKLHHIYQNPKILIKVLSDLVSKKQLAKEKLSIDFYLVGANQPNLENLAREYGLSGVVNHKGPVSFKESAAIQKRASGLLFFHWKGPYPEGWISAKIYEYIGAKRPILAIGSKGTAVDSLLNQTGCGLAADSKDEIKDILIGMYGDYMRNGEVKFEGRSEAISFYSRKEAARKMAATFDSLC